MILVEYLVWDDFNLSHINRHNVEKDDVEQALNNYLLTLPGHNERLLVIGKTIAGRLLTVVIDRHKPEGFYVVTARDVSQKEKYYLKQQENK